MSALEARRGTRRVIYAALVANVVIAVAKFAAWSITGNTSMLSEAYHSVSDTGNQVLILVGFRLGRGQPSRRYPFGRGNEQYFFAFVVSVLLFGVAGYASFHEGFRRLGTTYETTEVTVNYVVLAVALVFEGGALLRGYRHLRLEMERKGISSYLEAYRDSKDAALLTAVTEDTVAVIGVLVAGLGVYLTHATGRTVYDAGASMVIGLLLMGFALLLAWEDRGLIVGEGVTRSERKELLALLRVDPSVESVTDLRTLHFGTDTILVAAEVAFADDMDVDDVERAVDRIEARISDRFPGAKHIYIEASEG